MSHRKKGLKVLGLSITAVLGLMAFMAVSAQANWVILHPANTPLQVEALVELKNHSHFGTKLFVKEETKLEVLCLTISQDATAPLTLLASSTVAHGHVIFTNCKTWQNGVDVSANCKPTEPILAGGLAELILHTVGGVADSYILLKPLVAGGNFTQVKFVSPCALPSTNNIKGSITAECGHLNGSSEFVHLDCENHQVTQVLREVPETALFKHELKYGTKAALLEGLIDAKIESPLLYAGALFGGSI